MFRFLGEVGEELKKVTWPTKNHVKRLTVAVVAISLIVGAYLGSLDFIFTKMLEFLIK
ncbi:MAG: preprotein translocase subunit SecE [Armatimonadetes bacterium]|nr:MAG: preprotein translocase subunit SecE [Armatimonadota bacterium]